MLWPIIELAGIRQLLARMAYSSALFMDFIRFVHSLCILDVLTGEVILYGPYKVGRPFRVETMPIRNVPSCTVRTRHQETRLLKSGCPVSYKWTKENITGCRVSYK